MNQLSFDPWTTKEFQRRHEELIKEAEIYRLIRDAQKNNPIHPRRTSKILALIGKELTLLGTNLETRYSIEIESRTTLKRQNDPSGCS